jgi:hypothetical protein
MRKIVLLGLPLLINHASAKASEPNWGLLGPDFGIVNRLDLKANACEFKPVPFPPPDSSNFSYWRCFKVKDVSWEFDTASAAEPGEGLPELIAKDGMNREEYQFWRWWPYADFLGVLRVWKKLTLHLSHVCISGTYPSALANRDGGQTRTWLFSKYKTRRGCDAYFDGECDNRKAIREYCKTK